MQIERINDNQIRCTLTKEDLARRQLKLSELTYGSEKARDLFKEMMTKAYEEVGFESSNIPLMIEAIPVSVDCLVLIITKVEDPEEFDTRFSRFSKGSPSGEEDISPEAPADSSYASPGFSNLLADDPETLHYNEDLEDEDDQGRLSVSDDSDSYHFSSTRKDGDLETTLEISIEKDDQDSVPVDLFNMSAEEMLKYLAKRAREIREDLGQGRQSKDGADSLSPDRQEEEHDASAGDDLTGQKPADSGSQALLDQGGTGLLNGDRPGSPKEGDKASAPAVRQEAGPSVNGQDPVNPSSGPGRRTSSTGRAKASAARKDFRCYYFSNFTDISRLCAVLQPFYKGISSLYRDPSEGSYYLLLRRGDSNRNHFKRACTLAADFGKSLDLSYGTDSYFKEHFRAILPEDAVAQAASLL